MANTNPFQRQRNCGRISIPGKQIAADASPGAVKKFSNVFRPRHGVQNMQARPAGVVARTTLR
ncbi:hypothetical protein GGR77_001256 [Xanthomonas translucens]